MRDAGAMKLHGVLLDDAGSPVAHGAVTALVTRSGSAQPLALPAALSCGSSNDARADGDGSARVTTDDGGRFCVRLPIAVDRYTVEVRFDGSAYVDASSVVVPVDLSRRSCALAFMPEPRVLALDARSLTINASATLESDGQMAAGASLPLTLGTERGLVGSATTDASGIARFVIDPMKLGPPGQGELRVSFAGNADAAAANRTVAVERHARVVLDVPDADKGDKRELTPAAPEDGVTIVVNARAAGGGVGSGSIEARVNDVVVGAAPVQEGTARVLASFALAESMGAAREVPIGLRYVPNAPWYEAGADAVVKLPVRGRSPLRQWPLVLVGLALAAWFITSRAAIQMRARVALPASPRDGKAGRPGEAKLDLVRAAGAGGGWRGRAIDADDAAPIAAARVRIERPSFGRAEIVASAVTDDDGNFALPPSVPRTGDELTFDAPLHVGLRRGLPPPGELHVQLVLRKRALLARLVSWAKLRGRPFDARPEPTPGHVKRAAADDLRVARWADAVERAAYAGGPVDARVEEDVDRLAPGAEGRGAEAPARALANPTKANE